MKLKIGIFISGYGSNLEAIINSIECKKLDCEILFVFSNNKDAYGLKIAENAGINTICLPRFKFNNEIYELSRKKYEEDIFDLIKDYEIDYICLAGFMHILGSDFISHYENKIINIHPSLLPSFKGADGQKEAFDFGVKIAGCTTHFVTPEIDSGKIIAQAAISTDSCSTKDELAKKILSAEHFLYTYSLKKLALEDKRELEKMKEEAFSNGILLN